MAKSTIRIPKDPKHKITIPEEIWDLEKLQPGDYIEVDIKKIDNPKYIKKVE